MLFRFLPFLSLSINLIYSFRFVYFIAQQERNTNFMVSRTYMGFSYNKYLILSPVSIHQTSFHSISIIPLISILRSHSLSRNLCQTRLSAKRSKVIQCQCDTSQLGCCLLGNTFWVRLVRIPDNSNSPDIIWSQNRDS